MRGRWFSLGSLPGRMNLSLTSTEHSFGPFALLAVEDVLQLSFLFFGLVALEETLLVEKSNSSMSRVS